MLEVTSLKSIEAVRRVWQRLGRFALAVTLLSLLAYAALLALNWNDRPPSRAVTQLHDVLGQRAAVSDRDNAYVYMMGFAAAPDRDAAEVGRMRTAWAEQIAAGTTDARDPALPAIELTQMRSDAVRALSQQCQSADAQCARALNAQPETMRLWLDDEAWLLRRYESLLGHVAWREPAPLDLRVPLPSYAAVLEAQKLLHLQALQLAKAGEAERVRALLTRDAQFWRLTLRSADLLMTKMMAAAALRRHFEFGNLVLRELPAARVAAALPDEWRAELSLSERSMLRSLAGEWLYLDRVVKQAKRDGQRADSEGWPAEMWRRAIDPLFQPQHSSNRAADRLVAVATLLEVPYAKFTQALAEVRGLLREDQQAQSALTLYNTLGAALLYTAPADYTAYAVRVADIEGVRRAALLTALLRSEGVTEARLPGEIATAELRDPYSAKPFEWDDNAHTVVFTGLEDSDRRRHAFLY